MIILRWVHTGINEHCHHVVLKDVAEVAHHGSISRGAIQAQFSIKEALNHCGAEGHSGEGKFPRVPKVGSKY